MIVAAEATDATTRGTMNGVGKYDAEILAALPTEPDLVTPAPVTTLRLTIDPLVEAYDSGSQATTAE